MKSIELITAIREAGRRLAIVGTERDGVLIALDIEGRIFAFMDGQVLNRVNIDAITGFSTREGYVNPGGDGLWPAPEGSSLGYEYSTGDWRVPPSLTGARWLPVLQESNHAVFQAEVDLINASGTGLPFILSRDITVKRSGKEMSVSIVEGLEYIGSKDYTRQQAVVAPWSLCQFDCGEECVLKIHRPAEDSIWDLYQWDSSCHRHVNGNVCDVDMVTDFRFQLGMAPNVEWLEFVDKKRGFSVKRTADAPSEGCDYIDLADRDPAQPYSDAKPIRFSAYCDPTRFMEIEAAGGTPKLLTKGAKSCVRVNNVYTLL
ncbi:MAG: hypothetical protein IKS20_06740 [Victivallales bacterium]|nr:hypothetical protein [Victivallales bacterium]